MTTTDLREIGRRNWVLRSDMPSGCEPHVREMHSKNGLWRECFESRLRDADVQSAAIAFLQECGGRERDIHLAGNSVHSDYRYLLMQMPTLAKWFSHRILDISSLGLMARWNHVALTKSESIHRSLPDCDLSIAQYRECLGIFQRGANTEVSEA